MSAAQTPDQDGDAEAELIERAKKFDSEAWDALYDTYYPKMYTYLYMNLGDRVAAEDLAADVFEQACKGIHRFRYRGVSIAAWFYKIARNLMVDFVKRSRRTRVSSLDPESSKHGSTEDAANTIALRDELSRALRELTLDQQQVMVIRHVEGHNVAHTAKIMGKKENAVRAQEFRALHSLRRILSRSSGAK